MKLDKTKKLQIICMGAVLLFAAIMYIICRNASDAPIQSTPSEYAEPTNSKVPYAHIVIDPGHGGFDGGAAGVDSGVCEDELNLAVSLYLKEFLEGQNIKVTLTRADNNAIADTKKDDMKKRRDIMHNSQADLTVSIHMNKFSDRTISGPMVFYTKDDEPSRELAQKIMTSLCTATNRSARLANPGDYYVIRNSKIPAVIVECGFLSNAAEEKKLCQSDYQKLLAQSVSQGICDYLSIP